MAAPSPWNWKLAHAMIGCSLNGGYSSNWLRVSSWSSWCSYRTSGGVECIQDGSRIYVLMDCEVIHVCRFFLVGPGSPRRCAEASQLYPLYLEVSFQCRYICSAAGFFFFFFHRCPNETVKLRNPNEWTDNAWHSGCVKCCPVIRHWGAWLDSAWGMSVRCPGRTSHISLGLGLLPSGRWKRWQHQRQQTVVPELGPESMS